MKYDSDRLSQDAAESTLDAWEWNETFAQCRRCGTWVHWASSNGAAGCDECKGQPVEDEDD